MRKDVSMGCRVTQEILPILMIMGAFISISTALNLSYILSLIICHMIFIYWIITLKKSKIDKYDFRFLIIPIAVIITVNLNDFDKIPPLYDQAYHLQISNRILERWDWEPYHQGLSFSFRPELVSGLASIELFWSGEIYKITFTPMILLCSTCWAIQNLTEYYINTWSGFVAGIIFLFIPVVMRFGPTMMLDVPMAGMIVSLLLWLQKFNPEDKKYWVFFGLLTACLGLNKYQYFYIGPWIITLFYIRKKTLQGKYTMIGYSFLTTLFLIKNKINTNYFLGPMNSQISGTIASVSNELVGGEYTFIDFGSDFFDEFNIIILVLGLIGNIYLIKNNKNFFLNTWLIVIPAIILHGIILDFGYIRYSTPWIALTCVGVPVIFENVFNLIKSRYGNDNLIKIAIITIILILPVYDTYAYSEINKEKNNNKAERYWNYVGLYVEVGEFIPNDSIVITGNDISFSLYSGIESYRYLESEDPINHAIKKFNATHIFTDSKFYRYDIDVNYTFLYGSPIEPLKKFKSEYNDGYLWSVNKTKLNNFINWSNHSVEVKNGDTTYGSFLLLKDSNNIKNYSNYNFTRIIELNDMSEIDIIFDILVKEEGDERIICSDRDECSRVDYRSERGYIWAVWLE